jgi:hypothetical protein
MAGQRRIKGALVERKLIPADLFDAPSNAVPVQRAEGLQSLDDHQAEGAVEHVALVGCHVLGAYTSDVLVVNWYDGRRDRATGSGARRRASCASWRPCGTGPSGGHDPRDS